MLCDHNISQGHIRSPGKKGQTKKFRFRAVTHVFFCQIFTKNAKNVKPLLKRQNRSENKIRQIAVKSRNYVKSTCFWHVLCHISAIFEDIDLTYRDGPDHFCTCHLGAVFGTTPAGSAARRRPAIAGQCGRARGGFTSWFLYFKTINKKYAPTTRFTRLRGTIWTRL